MAGDGGEPAEGREELVEVVKNIGKGGGEPKGVRDVIQGRCAGGTNFRVIDVGDDLPYGPGPGRGFNTGYPDGLLGGSPSI